MQSPFHSLLLRSKYINWAFLSLRTFPPVHAKILFHRLNIYFPRGPCLMCIQATGDQSISASFEFLSCPTFIPPSYTPPQPPPDIRPKLCAHSGAETMRTVPHVGLHVQQLQGSDPRFPGQVLQDLQPGPAVLVELGADVQQRLPGSSELLPSKPFI